MTVLTAFPAHGDVLFDVRDEGRSLRIGWHPDAGIVVFSIWRNGSCVSSHQLDRTDVPQLISLLAAGLAVRPTPAWTAPTLVRFESRRSQLRDRIARLLPRR